MICPADENLNPRGELFMQLTRGKNSIKGAESIHLWISLVDAMKWKNKGGEYYVVNTTADIFALNEPLKH